MSDYWYYEYQVKIWGELDNDEEIRCGVIPAESMADVMKELEDYYGDELMEVQMLKPIYEGLVFDFKGVMDESEFNYVITKKI